MNAINSALEWITKMAYLNLLWILFTVLGLGVIGFFPATTATFAIVRKWIMGDLDIPVFKTFWSIYKTELVKSNLLGYILLLVGIILFIDIQLFNAAQSRILNLLAIPVVGMNIIFILTSLYVFPMYVHYEMKPMTIFKNSFFTMIINPLTTLTMIVGIAGIGFLFFTFQALIPIFSVSIMTLVIMMPSLRAFEKIESNKELNIENYS